MTTPMDLAKITLDLGEAHAALKAADAKESEAWRAVTAARARVNELQKEFDEAVALIRKDAPGGSEWAESGRQEV